MTEDTWHTPKPLARRFPAVYDAAMVNSGLKLAPKPVHRPYSTPPRPSLRQVPPPTPREDVELPEITRAAVLLGYVGLLAGAALLHAKVALPVAALEGAAGAAVVMIVHIVTSSFVRRGALGILALVAFSLVTGAFAAKVDDVQVRYAVIFLAAWPLSYAAGAVAREIGDAAKFLFNAKVYAAVLAIVGIAAFVLR
jgi:hypothetical protein